MRALATIRKIDNLIPIDGADFIEAAEIGGWKVVVKKGEHSVGELVIYFEIDSFIPEHLAPFLANGSSVKIYEGVSGFRLKTKRMKKYLSQGLILKISDVFQLVTDNGKTFINTCVSKQRDCKDSDANIQNTESNKQ